jgi:hypothetical protein
MKTPLLETISLLVLELCGIILMLSSFGGLFAVMAQNQYRAFFSKDPADLNWIVAEIVWALAQYLAGNIIYTGASDAMDYLQSSIPEQEVEP